jgi:Bacterial regulatory helix-turn-helix protein, lysR family
MIAPSLRHLRHLTALAEHRHFGRAAVASSVTQSTLSASIKELERLLEATLVDRSKRRVVFTPLGNETVERARKIVELVEELTNATLATREPLSGTLRMGSIPTVGPYLLPRVLPGLRSFYTRLKLYLVEDPARFGSQLTRSNHEIETSEMGFNGQFALHKSHAAHVGSGSWLCENAPSEGLADSDFSREAACCDR